MRKTTLFIALAVMLAAFSAGCATGGEVENDSAESAALEVVAPRELFSFRGTEENSPAPGGNEGEGFEDGEESSISIEEGFGREYQFNPMSKHLAPGEGFPPPPYAVDIDFTTLGGDDFENMFSEMTFMKPEEFIGQTIRLIGPYASMQSSGGDIHFVLVDDEEGCCQRFVEFEWGDGNASGEYPEDNTIIDIVGVLRIVHDEEWDISYPVLADSDVFVLGGYS